MRPKTLVTTAALVMLALLPAGLAQEDAIPDQLEKMLEAALKANPDLALAEAKVREAQAELNQTRLMVAKQVATLYHDRSRLVKLKRELTDNVDRIKAIAGRGAVGMDDVRAAVLALADADAKLAQTEAELRYVLGQGSEIKITFGSEIVRPAEKRRGGLPRPELDLSELPYLTNRVKVDWDAWSLPKILAALQAATENQVAFLLGPALSEEDAEEYVLTLRLPEPIKVVTAMQAIADYFRDHGFCFAITEYGVLLDYDHAVESMPVPTVPGNIPYRPDRR